MYKKTHPNWQKTLGIVAGVAPEYAPIAEI